ncbi:uncharacterized protein BP5553_07607 [Venustampulla echinocandica]|uniref:Uncharacterized protein n=1 Tax=Venustampulla echinocandica TaxID=2656787 RepID=A0A370TH01_9HELO|nr:uncharacterized protein BP5553_07607 [Venustampulla echinocandica]RDL34479.1 hypothetical protein BP5553_07607 [Venustampulla echinocandica]
MNTPADRQLDSSIETFFQAPPPGKSESFLDISDLQISQRTSGKKEFSDSGYSSRPSLSTTSQSSSSEMLERDPALSSSNCDQIHVTPDISIDSSTFDVAELLNFDGIDDVPPTDDNWLDILPNLHHMGTSASGFFGLANYHNFLPDQHVHQNNEATLKEPAYLPDLMELNFFDYNDELETRSL